MGYDHSYFDEQPAQGPSQPARIESIHQQMANRSAEERMQGWAKVQILNPQEARRLIWEGAILLILAPANKQPQELTLSKGMVVEICLNRRWGRDLKRHVNDLAFPIICCEEEPNNQRHITKMLQKLGFKHLFTIQPDQTPAEAEQLQGE